MSLYRTYRELETSMPSKVLIICITFFYPGNHEGVIVG